MFSQWGGEWGKGTLLAIYVNIAVNTYHSRDNHVVIKRNLIGAE